MSKKGIIVPGSESTTLTKGGGFYFPIKDQSPLTGLLNPFEDTCSSSDQEN